MLVKKMQFRCDKLGQQSNDIMYQRGYGYIWEAQDLIEMDTFLYEFSLTILDSEIQMWNTEVAQQPSHTI